MSHPVKELMVSAAGNQPIGKYCWIAFQKLSTVFSSGNPARVQVDVLDSNQATFSDAHLAERNVCSRVSVEGRKAVGQLLQSARSETGWPGIQPSGGWGQPAGRFRSCR